MSTSLGTVIAGVLVLCFGAVGCSDGERATDSGVQLSAGDVDAVALARERGIPVGLEALAGVGPDGVVADAGELARTAEVAGLSPAHVDAFADGQVSFSEYEALMMDAVECVRSRGVTVAELPPITDPSSGVTRVRYAIDAESPGLSEQEISAMDAECITQHAFAAQMLYSIQSGPPAEEIERRNQEQFAAYRECLVEKGIDLPPMEELMYDDLLAYVDVVPECEAP